MQQEVANLAGETHSREKPHDGRYSRHAMNPGSIQIDNLRLPIEEPRSGFHVHASATRPANGQMCDNYVILDSTITYWQLLMPWAIILGNASYSP